jgi:hypothetical protein
MESVLCKTIQNRVMEFPNKFVWIFPMEFPPVPSGFWFGRNLNSICEKAKHRQFPCIPNQLAMKSGRVMAGIKNPSTMPEADQIDPFTTVRSAA